MMRHALFLLALVACSAPDADPSRRAQPPRPAPAVAVRPQFVAQPLPDSTTATFDAGGHPILPVVMTGYCQGEDCATHFGAVACLPAQLRATPSDSSPVVRTLAAGDSLAVSQRSLVVPQVGLVVVQKDFVLDWEIDMDSDQRFPRPDTVRFSRGDTIFVLAYGALGSWMWAHRSKVNGGAQFWASAGDQELGAHLKDSSLAVAYSSPKSEDWWLVRPAAGAPGWWHADNREELQAVSGMQHWNDSCAQVRKRAGTAAP